jgi:CRISPR system Cascade subunit CasD
MKTLLLRLGAPLQSWGSDSKFERRTTQREPTKSGVIGILAAALGRTREESLDDLARLNFGVRIDQPGQLLRDFHTARHTEDKAPYVTKRYYLSDAVFLAGLEGETEFLELLASAVDSPVFPLYLGRRSCPPEGRVSLGLRDKSLETALREEPWQAASWRQEKRHNSHANLTIVMDSIDTSHIRRRDLPISFSQKHRKYAYRYISDMPLATQHDVFDSLGV